MKNIKTLFDNKFFRIFVWLFISIIVIFVLLVIIRVPHYLKVQKTDNQIIKIHSDRISLKDVMGYNLPSDPGIESDQTIKGIDSNNNGIRDDVELAIFKEYPNSAKTRAVLLQYAAALQKETNQPFINKELTTEIVREEGRGFACVGKLFPNKESDESYKNLLSTVLFIEDKQLDSQERKDHRNNFLKNAGEYSDLEEECDIDLSKLPN